jgi:Mg-chelatase subunit ChlD
MVCAAILTRAAVSSEVAGRPITAACRTGNPYFAVTRPSMYPSELWPPIAAVRDTTATLRAGQLAAQILLASRTDVGAVYGLAYDWRRQHLYASAVHMGMAFGPGGPGAIYRIDLATGHVRLWATLDAGEDRYVPRGGYQSYGKTSLGDIEIDDEGTTLFAVNLHDRRIYRLSLPDGQLLGSFEHGAAHEPWAPNARPFGLGYNLGWLYHGVVDSREQETLPGILSGTLYRSRPDGSDIATAAEFRFDYVHSPPWHAWIDDWQGVSDRDGQPIIRDVEFRANGDPIVGIGQRFWVATGHGDALSTTPAGAGVWRVLTNAQHYFDRGCDSDDCGIGTLARFPGRDVVVSSMVLSDSCVDGLVWLANTDGNLAGPNDGQEFLADDDIGVGDIEPLCPPSAGIYLPMVSRGWCAKPRQVDVVLVLDMSTSMAARSRDGRPKHEAAISAASGFVGLLDLAANGEDTRDQAAVVGFNEGAWVEQGLTSEATALHAALRRLPTRIAEGTRLDLALARAFEVVVSGARRGGNLPVVILLTDGLPNRVPPAEDGSQDTTVLRAADGLKATGAQLYTIGLGLPGDLNEDLLRQVASWPSLYYYAPDAEHLAEIYAQLAEVVGCP